MPISMDRLIFEPKVEVISNTLIINPGLDAAIAQIGAEDIAVTPGTPLNNLTARVMGSGEHTGGTGDDLVEFAGRQCYRSWERGRPPEEYIANLVGEGHGSVFEHASIGFQMTGISRAFSHELIRHSVGTAVSQESQRFVDASEVMFVVPPLLADRVQMLETDEQQDDDELTEFRIACGRSLAGYASLQQKFRARLLEMAGEGVTAEQKRLFRKRANEAARSTLINAAETRMVYSTNLRALRHILLQRANHHADLEIRKVAVLMFEAGVGYAPHFFRDMEVHVGPDGLASVQSTWGRV